MTSERPGASGILCPPGGAGLGRGPSLPDDERRLLLLGLEADLEGDSLVEVAVAPPAPQVLGEDVRAEAEPAEAQGEAALHARLHHLEAVGSVEDVEREQGET